MVVARLMGGLGNQMFQYALGRHLALLNSSDLRLDVDAFRSSSLRSYRLHHFNVKASIASRKDIFWCRLPPPSWWFARERNSSIAGPLIRERTIRFDPAVLEQRGRLYLDGYWQSPDYFSDIAHLIRRDFTLASPLSEETIEVGRQISDVSSLSIHVRLGDYLTNARVRQVHGVLDRKYYSAATDLVLESFPGVHAFLFSDEPEEARKLVDFPNERLTVVHHNDSTRDFEDLHLMRLCDHHVIANSTFSWWGAWLRANQDGVVVAPKTWFHGHPEGEGSIMPAVWKLV